MDIELSVIIPAYNEEKAIKSTFRNLNLNLKNLNIPYEIIFVDDGSTDKTAELIQTCPGTSLIQHPDNKGYGAALKTGIRHARGTYILITDADGTYPHNEIPNLWKYAYSYDMIVGSRTGKNVKIPLYRQPAKRFINWVANFLSGTKIPDINSGMRIFKKKQAMNYFNIICDGFSFTTTITLAYLAQNLKIKYYPINYEERIGKSKINPIHDGLRFILLIITTTTYFNPLKVFLSTGFFIIILGLIIGIRVLIHFFSTGSVTPHFPSALLTITLIIVGIQIIGFGLVAEMNRNHRMLTEELLNRIND